MLLDSLASDAIANDGALFVVGGEPAGSYCTTYEPLLPGLPEPDQRVAGRKVLKLPDDLIATGQIEL